jgi:hypothetical protein
LQHEFSHLCAPHELERIFANIEELLPVTQRLYQRLLVEHSKSDAAQQMIGMAFLEVVNDLKVYKPYCINHPTSNETIAKVKNNPEFIQFLSQLKKNEENKNLAITDQLIKPFQRIVRYSMLLKVSE